MSASGMARAGLLRNAGYRCQWAERGQHCDRAGAPPTKAWCLWGPCRAPPSGFTPRRIVRDHPRWLIVVTRNGPAASCHLVAALRNGSPAGALCARQCGTVGAVHVVPNWHDMVGHAVPIHQSPGDRDGVGCLGVTSPLVTFVTGPALSSNRNGFKTGAWSSALAVSITTAG